MLWHLIIDFSAINFTLQLTDASIDSEKLRFFLTRETIVLGSFGTDVIECLLLLYIISILLLEAKLGKLLSGHIFKQLH